LTEDTSRSTVEVNESSERAFLVENSAVAILIGSLSKIRFSE